MFFPGTEAAIGGLRPSHWHEYDRRLPNRARVDAVLEWLRLPPDERPHLITAYFSMVDGAGHDLGPDTPELNDVIRSADRWLGELLSGIEQIPYAPQVYVVVVSDHGMASVDRQIVLSDIVDLRGVRSVPLGPGISLHLNGNDVRSAEIRDAFNSSVRAADARAFLRHEAPGHLHVGNDPRYGDVILVPAEGMMLAFSPDASLPLGMHGWDPNLPSMGGIFLARGPKIEAGQTLKPFEMIHIYPFLADILGLVPNPEIDGSVGVLAEVLSGR